MPAAKKIEDALFAAQEELLQLVLTKDARNPHFKNSYLTLDGLLEKILPVLRNNDILLTQPVAVSGGELALDTRLYHVPSGTEILSTMPLNKLQREDPQGQGSAITYARRYSLMSMLGLVADEDDDGNAAQAPKPKRRSSSRKAKSAEAVAGDEAHSPGSDSADDGDDESW